VDAREDQSSPQDPTVHQRLAVIEDSALFHFKPSKQPTTPRRAVGPPGEAHVAGRRHTTPINQRPPHRSEVKLLRKEVIQPHLPVRLPCYDFVPIASPTFDRSPP
jgi:hypothetical protein